jgi:hypothetical protein
VVVPATVVPAVFTTLETVLPTALVTPLAAGTALPTAVVTAVVVPATVPVTAVVVLATVPVAVVTVLAAAVVTCEVTELRVPVIPETVDPAELRRLPLGELTVAACAGAASRRPMPKATARPPVTAPTAYKNTLRAGMHQPFMSVTLIHIQHQCPYPEHN